MYRIRACCSFRESSGSVHTPEQRKTKYLQNLTNNSLYYLIKDIIMRIDLCVRQILRESEGYQ